MSRRSQADALGMALHIPGLFKTYCGRPNSHVLCIDKTRNAIDEATCKACHRSDDRRVREAYHEEMREKRERQRKATKEVCGR